MASKTFKIIDTLRKRLHIASATSVPKKGVIFGYNQIKHDCCYCLGICLDKNEIPCDNQLIGVFILNQTYEDVSITETVKELTKKSSGKILIYHNDYKLDKKHNEVFVLFDAKKNKLSEINCEEVSYQEALEPLVLIELNYLFRIKFKLIDNMDDVIAKEFKIAYEDLEKIEFKLDQSSFKLNKGNNQLIDLSIENLYEQMDKIEEFSDVQMPPKIRKKVLEKAQKQLRSTKSKLIFYSNDTELDKSSLNTKLIDLSINQNFDLKIPIKLFFNVQLHESVQNLFRFFSNSLKNILVKLQSAFEDYKNNVRSKTEKHSLPKVISFYQPSIYTHFIAAVFSKIHHNGDFRNERESLHTQFLVPSSRPQFRLNIAFGAKFESERIKNVHLGLENVLKNGKTYLVKGSYVYFHYNQDHIKDSGWGCAYRSLQTIISWFHLQGYIYISSVPNHKSIQMALFSVKDKPKEFVGSSQWIGSQEVCYALDHLYRIKSKIIFVSSPSELTGQIRILIKHFEENGSPIMIGGGVLAHTILGVAFDENNGDCRFLVLDPHYIGEDDVANIQRKGGCSWQTVSFWDENSFYNLCLPQVEEEF
ncbi:Acyl-coenzyme A thioesterase 13 [Sarcoptes scabiei]|nr:Acyl-coenzyme A thioesterase 13 [Sarcoptes scabiei]